MSAAPVHIQIIGAPVACAQGVNDTWREVAGWAEGQLTQRFGDAVQVRYFDLLDPDCPAIPPDAQLPLVFIETEVVISGGKISVPLLRRRLEELGLEPQASPTEVGRHDDVSHSA